MSLTTFPTPGESWHLVRPGSESGAESGNAGLRAAPGERCPGHLALSLLLNVASQEWVSRAVVGNKPSFPFSRPRPHCPRGSTGQGSRWGEASPRVPSAPHRLWVSSCLVSAGNATSPHQEKVPQRSSIPCPGWRDRLPDTESPEITGGGGGGGRAPPSSPRAPASLRVLYAPPASQSVIFWIEGWATS